MNTVLLHLERLRRHYGAVVRTNDHVSLLDLSHTLRLWTELKKPLEKIAPKFASAISFKTAIPAKKVLKAARGHRYVFSYMPGGVVTYASQGHLASGPGMENDGDFALGVAVRVSPPTIELGKFSFVSCAFEQPLIKALDAETVTRCTFVQWLGAEAVRVAYVNGKGDYEVIAISREMVVKRVANTLDGSHPSAAGEGGETDNTFDEPIHYLLKYQVGGLPLPYFILLKIAQDLLEIAPKLLGINDAKAAT